MSPKDPELRAPRILERLAESFTRCKEGPLVGGQGVQARRTCMLAWEKVRAQQVAAGGVDGVSHGWISRKELARATSDGLHVELKDRHLPTRNRRVRTLDSQGGSSRGSIASLGIPTIYDRVCQQALRNRLEPIFEPAIRCTPTSDTGADEIGQRCHGQDDWRESASWRAASGLSMPT